MAWVSLGKLALLLAIFAMPWLARASDPSGPPLQHSLSMRISLAIGLVWAVSLLWTKVAPLEGLHALGKHLKFAEVVMLMALIRNPSQARWAMGWFLIGQLGLVLQGWLLWVGVPLPWTTGFKHPSDGLRYSVYSTYLDQTLLYAGTAAVSWHLRKRWPGLALGCIGLALAAIAHNFLLQPGRTGWLVSLAVLGSALLSDLKPRARRTTLISVLVMFAALAGLIPGSISDRLSLSIKEIQSYVQTGNASTSIGFRMRAWSLSIQAVARRPLEGYGVGSWTQTVKQIEGERADDIFGTATSNPHQEYLLWAVSLGIAGPAMLLAWMGAMVWDARRAPRDLRAALFSVLTALAIASLFNSALYDALVGDFFVITLGLLVAWSWREDAVDAQETAT